MITSEKSVFLRYQALAWIIGYILFTLYLYQRLGELPYAVGIGTCAFIFFAIIIYSYSFSYSLFFYRLLYKRIPPVYFWLAILLFIGCISLLRVYIEYAFISKLFSRESFFTAGRAHFAYVFVTNFMALLLGVLLKWVSEYFIIKAKQAILEKKQLETEMKLLKTQLQPHFLFNCLNNIYYEAYTESPKAAQLIEKLSGIMRYFFEINSREMIPVGQEISFIRNYIELEQIRCHFPVKVEIISEIDPATSIPPMLMTPLVENSIKHGIDKKRKDNFISIRIRHSGNVICFLATNRLLPAQATTNGTGLVNLRERLRLLYKDQYELQTCAEDGIYTATLKIPVA